MKRIMVVFLAMLLCVSLSGCGFIGQVLESMTKEVDAEREMQHSIARDGDWYEFSGQTTLWIDAHAQEEFIVDYDTVLRYDDDLNNGVLKGKFDLWAWHNFELFIVMDEQFYVYDIKGTKRAASERLQTYTEHELAAVYPDYRDYGWSISGWKERTEAARKKYPHLMGE